MIPPGSGRRRAGRSPPAASNSFTVQTSTFTDNGIAIDISQSQVSNLAFQVLNNPTITGTDAVAINAFSAAGSDTGPGSHSFVGKIDGNVIGTQGTADSGSRIGSGIRAVVQGQNTQGAITISNNTIREVVNADIITLIGQNGDATTGSNTARFKVVNNAMPLPSGSNEDLCASGSPRPVRGWEYSRWPTRGLRCAPPSRATRSTTSRQ